MKSCFRNLLCSIVFLFIFSFLFFKIFKVLETHSDERAAETFYSFYKLPKNSVDALWIGSSSIKWYFFPAVAYEECGVTIFPLATCGQPFVTSKFLVQEALKTQKPKVIFVELWMLSSIQDNSFPNSEGYLREVLDSARKSPEWIKAVHYTVNEREKLIPGFGKKLDYFFKFRKYHSRWQELQKSNFEKFSGHFVNESPLGLHNFETHTDINDLPPVELNENVKKELSYFLNFCKKINCKVVFTNTPNFKGDGWKSKLNALKIFLNERGYEVLDFDEMFTELKMDASHDFTDVDHANIVGAEKFSRNVSKFLKAKYNLSDHSAEKDKKYQAWKSEINCFYNDYIKRIFDFYNYLSVLKNHSERYTVFLSVKDEASGALTDSLLTKISDLELEKSLSGQWRKSYSAIIDRGKKIYESLAETTSESVEFSDVLENGLSVSIKSAGLEAGNYSSIEINGKEYSKNFRGINIVVYDNELKQITDSVCFDTCLNCVAYR